MGVGVGEFKSIRFSPMEGAGGGMLPLVEVLPGVGAGTGGGATYSTTSSRIMVSCRSSGLFIECTP